MLDRGDENFVSLPDVLAAVTLGNEVDCLGRSAQKNDLLRVSRADETPYLVARAFKSVGRPFREFIGSAMDV